MVGIHGEILKGIAHKTFEITCYMFPLDDWEIEQQGEVTLGDNSTSALVEFDGATEGAMSLRVSPELLNAIAENMLGMEEADTDLKEGALREIANIICGNTVPVFARNDKICYIRPPQIIMDYQSTVKKFEHMQKENLQIWLDEGVAELTIYYSTT